MVDDDRQWVGGASFFRCRRQCRCTPAFPVHRAISKTPSFVSTVVQLHRRFPRRQRLPRGGLPIENDFDDDGQLGVVLQMPTMPSRPEDLCQHHLLPFFRQMDGSPLM